MLLGDLEEHAPEVVRDERGHRREEHTERIDEPVGAQRLYRLRPDGMDAIRTYFEGLWGEAAARYRLTVENLGERKAR